MDGVLVDIGSSWQFVHKRFNVDNRDNLKEFLNHRISYGEFMKKDIALWGTVNMETLKNILSEVPLMIGAELAVTQLRKEGYKTAIISAGISILAERIQQKLKIDHIYANKIIAHKNGVLTGEEVVNPLNKIAVLRELASKEHMTLLNCAVIGDTIFDVSMFKAAGFSIAFNTKNEQVRQAADVVVEDKDLKEILPYFTR
jgi:phosphoserine phosphatase